jgi:methylthioribose-1-phosphate isomerase
MIFKDDQLQIIDQTRLPAERVYITLSSKEESFDAIARLRVRGAPAIGIVAAYTMYIVARRSSDLPLSKMHSELDSAARYLQKSRPTAVNLSWAIRRMQAVYKTANHPDTATLIRSMRAEAVAIHEEDARACRAMGQVGAELIADDFNILTHCHTGSLATGGWGTALGVIYAAAEAGRRLHVYVDETRPLGQGGRLTFWELMQHNIPCTLITDSMAGSLMRAGRINLVLFGADRIARNGDVANKIGTYSVAALANMHAIPVYSVAPLSTIDADMKSGADIPIEQRSSKEVLQIYGYNDTLLDNASVYNPAFDITPAGLLSGIITEKGILGKPFDKSISKILNLK